MEYGNYRFTSGYQAARKLLEQELTAILCFNDEMAFGAREAIVELGLKVPDDISLIGFDNWDMSGYASMKLTTVERNMGDIANRGHPDSPAPPGGRNHRQPQSVPGE